MSQSSAAKQDEPVVIDLESDATMKRLPKQGSDDKSTEDDSRSDSLSKQETDKVNELLESAIQTAENKFDLRGGFYSDPLTAASWHHLSEKDVNEHHRSGLYRHMRHPLGTVDASAVGEHRRQRRHYASPRAVASVSTVSTFTPYLSSVEENDVHNGGLPDSAVAPVPSVSESAPLLADNQLPMSRLSGDDDVAVLDMPVSDTPVSETEVWAELKPDAKLDVVSELVTGDTGQPLVSLQRTYRRNESTPKVCFILGADPDEPDGAEPSVSPIKRCPSRTSASGRTRHIHRASSQSRDLSLRRRLGSEVSCTNEGRLSIPTEQEEAAMLDSVDLDDIASHRFGDTTGMHRRKISHHSAMASIVHIGQIDKAVKSQAASKKKRVADSEHHKMFVELDELRLGDNEEWAWQEKARWIKFEEEIEEDAVRWGKPHVSSLSFHSLLELRRCIEHGVIVLDLDATDLPAIASHVVDQLVLSEQLRPDCKGHVLKALLLRHRHLADQQRPLLPRNLSHLNLFNFSQSLSGSTLKEQPSVSCHIDCANNADAVDAKSPSSFAPKAASVNGLDSDQNNHNKALNGGTDTPRVKESVTPLLPSNRPSSISLAPVAPSTPAHVDSHIIHRIPSGSEATNVLVGSVDFLDAPVMAFVRLKEACHLGNLTEVALPVRFIFILLGPSNTSSLDYHEIGRSISTLMADERFHDVAYIADSRRDLLEAINEFLHDSIVLPPGEYDKKALLPIMDMAREKVLKKRDRKKTRSSSSLDKPDPYGDPLRRTGRLFGGLVNDVKRRFPYYLSDIKDSFNIQCLAALFFVYFACLSPAITFGGLLGDKTDKLMGVTEMLVATAICGVVFALFSGQPLVIIGATGPIVVFEEALYKICTALDIEFLAFRWWVALWIGIVTTIVIMVEGSFLVRYVTRFTEEIFALLISLIFIYEVFKKLTYVFLKNPLLKFYPIPVLNCHYDNETMDMGDENVTDLWFTRSLLETSTHNWTNVTAENVTDCSMPKYAHPNTALLSLILTAGTFLLAFTLKAFRNSRFLGRSVRRAIGDFGIPISIVIMVLVDFLITETYTEKLDVPDGIKPTAPHKRAWFVNPLGSHSVLPVWAMFAAVIPALLVFILLFMEAQITSMIINKKDRCLKKGSGYHLDLFLIGILSVVCGMLGVPLMCSATVRSVTHVSALSVYSRTHAPGEKPRLINVIEQRVSSLAVHIMIGVSALMGPVLRQIPLAVLFGIFLYMGFASMTGVQLVHRLKLMFMPVKHHPEDVGYVRRVRLWKMNLFTVIQLVCLAVLWVVKSTTAALAFPFVLTLMVPLRLFLLPVFFTCQELVQLDRDEASGGHGDEDEPDFYVQAHMPQ